MKSYRASRSVIRTTLSLDPDVLCNAKRLAASQSKSLSTVISELVQKGLNITEREVKTENGFPLFDVSKTTPMFSLEDTKRAEDEDDEQHGFGLNR